MAEKRNASQAQRCRPRTLWSPQATSTKCAGWGPHYAKGCLGGTTPQVPFWIMVNLLAQLAHRTSWISWDRTLEALPPWLPLWASAKATFMMGKTATENNRHLANRQTRIAPAGSLYPVGPSPAWHTQARPGTPLSEGGTKGGETERKLRKQLEWSKQNFRPGDPKQTVRHICLLSLPPGNKAVLFHVVYQRRLVFRTPGKVFCFFKKLHNTFRLSFKGKFNSSRPSPSSQLKGTERALSFLFSIQNHWFLAPLKVWRQ